MGKLGFQWEREHRQRQCGPKGHSGPQRGQLIWRRVTHPFNLCVSSPFSQPAAYEILTVVWAQ